jgi:integrase
MAREINRLSQPAIRNAKPGVYCDGNGLYLQVTAGAAGINNKSWVWRYATGRTITSSTGKVRREERQLGLGSLANVTLAEARELAAGCRRQLEQGTDPIESRRSARAAQAVSAKGMTFDDCAAAYMKSHRAGWKNPKHASQWQATLETYASPVVGKLPVQTVDAGLVLKVLQPIWSTKPETASRVRGRIEAVLSWAKAHGMRTGDNPATWRGHLDQLLPPRSKVRTVKHHAALPYAELPAFMDALRLQEGVSARALEFTILTAARTSETIGARWPEIDVQRALWTVPPERMKAGKSHVVPISGPALAIIKRQAEQRENEFVFPGDKRAGLSNMALLMTLRRMGRSDLTAHGFRSTFRDWAGDKSDFAREVVEAALAHAVGDKAEQAYRRSDALEKRRKLMDAWASYCGKPAATGKVLTFPA